MLFLFATVFLGCSDASLNANHTIESVRPVKTKVVHKTVGSESRVFPGIVRAARESELAFRVGGPLIEYNIRIGQRVNQGDVLARIDPRDFEVKVIRVSAELERSRANLKAMRKGARAEDIARLEAEQRAATSRLSDAQKNYNRQNNLLAEHATAKVHYDAAKTAYDNAKAGLEVVVQELIKARKGSRIEDIEAAEAQIKSLMADLKAAQNDLADTILIAPFDGYIRHKYFENHETVSASQPVISLLDYSTIEVRTAVPEDIIVRQTFISDIFCTLESFPGRQIRATVKEIGRETDFSNQSYPITVVLQPSEEFLVESGMAATVHLVLKDENHAASRYLCANRRAFFRWCWKNMRLAYRF